MGKHHIPPLQAGRVRLRLLEGRDLPRTLAWRNQDHVRRWFFSGQRLTLEQHALWFARYQHRDDDFVFVIEEVESSRHTPCAVRPAAPAAGIVPTPASSGGRQTDQASMAPTACCLAPEAGDRQAGSRPRPIGQAALYNVDWVNGTAEFGRLMVGVADAAGRGLAREATAAIVALAFEQLGLQEVYLEVVPGNVRAIKVYEACGFEVTGSTEKAVRMSKRAVTGAASEGRESMLVNRTIGPTEPARKYLCSVIFPFFGRYECVEEGIFLRLAEMEPFRENFEFVFVLDGPQWKTLPLVQDLSARFPQATVVGIDHQTDLPAALLNAGIRASRGEVVTFALANQPWIAQNYQRLAEAAQTGGLERAYYLSFPEMLGDHPLPSRALLYGWQQYRSLLALTGAAVPRKLVCRNEIFDESPLLQTACDWEWFLRLSKIAEIRHVGEHAGPATASPFERYPLGRHFRPSRDLEQRYVVRAKEPTHGHHVGHHVPMVVAGGKGASEAWCQESFLRDVGPDDADYLRRRAAAFGLKSEAADHAAAVAAPPPPSYKIAITGGDWEYHHNRLYFFEYLDYLQGSGLGSYKVLLDRAVTDADLAGNDLVILTRTRCDRVKFIIDRCAAMGIPTIYMIDDNWLTFAADYPKPYASLFSPGRPDYENFLYGLRHATAALTCSPILADDITPYARRVLCLPMSVPLAEFESVPRPPQGDGFVVGFAGSLRHDDAAFAAMAAVARQRDDVRLLLFGDLSQEQGRMFDGLNPIRLPADTYDGYIRQIRQTGPDILVAPLGNTRTAQSKAPTKYLDITAAGAAGIYSAVPPYVWHVEHGRNGILVQDSDSEAEWKEAIVGLLDHRELTRIWRAARDDVGKNHDVPVVAEEFRRMIVDFLAPAKAA